MFNVFHWDNWLFKSHLIILFEQQIVYGHSTSTAPPNRYMFDVILLYPINSRPIGVANPVFENNHSNEYETLIMIYMAHNAFWRKKVPCSNLQINTNKQRQLSFTVACLPSVTAANISLCVLKMVGWIVDGYVRGNYTQMLDTTVIIKSTTSCSSK